MSTDQHLSNAPENQWALVIPDYEDVTFKMKTFEVPGFGFDSQKHGNLDTIKLPTSGTHLEYEPLSTQVFIDGNWANFLSVSKWIRDNVGIDVLDTRDASLMLLSPQGQEQGITLLFEDLFPHRLGGIELNTIGDLTDITMSITWGYTKYDIQPIYSS